MGREREKEKFHRFTMLNVDRNACEKRDSVTQRREKERARSLIHFSEKGILSETKVSEFLHLLIINCDLFLDKKLQEIAAWWKKRVKQTMAAAGYKKYKQYFTTAGESFLFSICCVQHDSCALIES
jgi:hypothetical protein